MTQKGLKILLSYSSDTGLFIWLVRPSAKVRIGDTAGCILSNGYLQITIKGNRYSAHRLAWLYMTGKWPKDKIDHKNHDTTDNRWCNLRGCNVSQNGGNRKIGINNTSGYKGVSWNKQNKKWLVQINKNKVRYALGYFNCKHKAAETYNNRALELYGEFAHLNKII